MQSGEDVKNIITRYQSIDGHSFFFMSLTVIKKISEEDHSWSSCFIVTVMKSTLNYCLT